MKNLLNWLSNLSRRSKTVLGVVTVLVVLLIAGGVYFYYAEMPTMTTEAMYGSTGVVSFYPNPACIALNRRIPIVVKGMEYGDPGRDYWSSNGDNVSAPSVSWKLGKIRFMTGKVVNGSATLYIGGAAHIVKDGDVHVTVRNEYADCWDYYLGNGINNETPRPDFNSGATNFTFFFVSDTQGCNACVSDDNVANHDFNKAVARKAGVEKPAFIINGGDLSNYGNRSQMFYDDVLSEWTRTGTDIKSIPLYSTVGNHELVRAALGNYQKVQQDDLKSTEYQSSYFDKVGWAWPKNAGDEYKNLAYSFRYGNSMFIITDDFYMWGDNGNDTFTNGDMMYKGVDLRQLAFVDHEGKDATNMGLTHAFVIGHSHLWPTDLSGDPSVEFSTYFRQDLAEIVLGRNVFSAYFTGHGGGLDLNGSYTNASGTHKVDQFIAETGTGEKSPNYMLRVQVNGKTVTVTPLSRGSNAGDNWFEGTPVVYTKP